MARRIWLWWTQRSQIPLCWVERAQKRQQCSAFHGERLVEIVGSGSGDRRELHLSAVRQCSSSVTGRALASRTMADADLLEREIDEQPPHKWFSRRIKEGDRDAVLAELGTWKIRQVFTLMQELPLKRARVLFHWLPMARAIGILDVVDPEAGAILAADETIDRLIEIAEGLDIDEAVERITHLPEETRERVIERLPPGDLAARLSYGLDTAATIMTDQFIAVPASWTLTRTVAAIQDRAAKVGSVRAIYAMDDDGGLIGYLEPEDLLVHAGTDTVGQWVHTDVVSVRPRLDQEEVLRVARDAGVSTIPVVDIHGRLLGGITPDELAEVLADELQENLNIASGLDPDAGPNDRVSVMIRHRLPWLLAGLVGSTLAGVAVGLFEKQLLEAAILASFIPVVMAMAGNAGIQASQVTVSGMSTGIIWHGDHLRRVLRETATGLSNSFIVGLVLSVFIVVTSGLNDIDRPGELAATATFALMVAMTMATTLGAVIPLVLRRLGADPAVATGVFIAAANDILGVSIFFIIATALYL